MNQRLTSNDHGESADDAAERWMARKMSGAMNAEERGAFESWLAASAENRRAFAELERALGRIDAQAETLLAEEFERQLTRESAAKDMRRKTAFNAVAASLVAVACAGVIAVFLGGERGDVATIAYETKIGQSETIALADGSEIELNTDSRITVAFNDAERSVKIEEGEAFFNVEKDRARPFIVTTGVAEIAVTGTSFNVSTFGDSASVHVLTGVVDVKPANGHAATLLAGDKLSIGRDGVGGEISRYDPTLVFAWRSGKARFRAEPLGNVVTSLNRYFETPIVLGDESLAGLPVTGEFDIRDRATAVKALALVFGLETRDEPARTILMEPSAR